VKGLVHEILHNESSDERLEHFLLWICQLRPSRFRVRESAEGQLKWFALKNIAKFKEEIIPSDFRMIRKFFLEKSAAITFYKVKMIKIRTGYRIEETDL